ncbi:HlyD family type I secretion periplasmic adaptor subunit [Sneathiella sp. P13V-1]|uniref:HlyD family type I secretion periplasmic adaptor subunit n=1 Tax=Sneathiella sp. P13V-1 TaxID=2697366 RepID=UPI00187B4878|nr:HlyD family type I secretion periplasmic adaptor subunit [Sneathiella sp. P13V-1]MBE7636620.1 HlyD family type I secretion periplasmic adaptor subunit [Sneathiella sp. P13V-1]
MKKYSDLEKHYPLPARRLIGWTVILIVVGFLIWTQVAKLDEVSVLSGEVVPQDQVKVIQHLEGGIVKEVHVRDGSIVRKGDPLMQLDLAVNAINEDALLIQLSGAQIKRARLVAEAEGKKPIYPVVSNEAVLPVLNAEKKVHAARQAQLNSKLRILKDKAQQKQQDVEQLSIKISTVSSDLEVLRRKFAMSTELLASKLTPKIEHLELETELTRLQGEMRVLKASVPKTHSLASEAKEKIEEEKLNYRLQAQEEQALVEQEIARLKELLITAGDQVTRTTVRSPIDGVIKNLRYNTIGGIIRAGDIIMDVVPTSDRLVVEARLNPADRGFVEVGQSAVVKLTAYDFFIYGGIKGKISNIAADSTTDQDGQPFYKVVVETDDADENLKGLLISPGMQAMVDVHTGKKTVMQYLLQPVLKMKHESFRER